MSDCGSYKFDSSANQAVRENGLEQIGIFRIKSVKLVCSHLQFQVGFFVRGGFDQGSHYIQTQVHEKNALTLTSSQTLGISSKLIDTDINEDFVSAISYEVNQEKMSRYPKESRGKCNPGNCRISESNAAPAKNVLFATDASNAEIDIFSCLLDIAERKAGCKTLRKFSQYNSTGRPTDSNICYDMRPFQNAADEQLKWIEHEMAQAGCVPSCTRHSYNLLDGIYSKMPYAGYVSLLPKAASPRKLVLLL